MHVWRSWFGTALLAVSVLLTSSAGADPATGSKTIQLVEKAGGKLTRDGRKSGNPVVGVDFDDVKVTDAVLKELAGLPLLTKVSLERTPVGDAGVRSLASLKGLQELSLAQTKITDNSL